MLVQARHVYDMIKGLIDTLVDIIGQFPALKDEVTALIDSSKEVFADPTSKISAAGLSMGDAMKVPVAIKKDLTILASLPAVFVAFVGLGKSLADELAAAVEQLKAL